MLEMSDLSILSNFFVFEGLDGSGTTTQSAKLCDYLIHRGRDVFQTAEPTDSDIGSFIRNNILKCKISINPRTLLYLYLADRNEHMFSENGILSKIKAGKIVICDRFLYSTLAYQGMNMDIDEISALCDYLPLPKVVFYINTSVEECLKRIEKRGEERELFEKKALLEKIKSNYDKIFNMDKYRTNLVEIDGNKSVDEIFNLVRITIDELI